MQEPVLTPRSQRGGALRSKSSVLKAYLPRRRGAPASHSGCVKSRARAPSAARARRRPAYMVAAGHEERNRDDHGERMLALAKVTYSSQQRASC